MEESGRFSVLIVLMGSLGDIARGLFLAAALKKGRPDCRLSWLVDARFADLLVGHPHIDRVLVFNRRCPWPSWYRLVTQLRQCRFDVVLDLQRILKSGLLTRLTGAPIRVGFHRDNGKEFNHLFNNRQIDYLPETHSKLENYQLFLRKLGLAGQAPLDFGLEHLTLEALGSPWATLVLPDSIALVLGSSRVEKNWGQQGYHDLIGHLLKQLGCQILLLGSAEQDGLGAELKAGARSAAVLNLAGRTSLRELAALLRRVRLAVGPDSGPGHLAAAVGTPYVGLFGPTDPRRVAPYNCLSWALQSADGLAGISADMVLTRVLGVWKECVP